VKSEFKLLHVIIPLLTAYLEYTCVNPWERPERRVWVYRRTVDHAAITLL
jgi:hypothetical protein